MELGLDLGVFGKVEEGVGEGIGCGVAWDERC